MQRDRFNVKRSVQYIFALGLILGVLTSIPTVNAVDYTISGQVVDIDGVGIDNVWAFLWNEGLGVGNDIKIATSGGGYFELTAPEGLYEIGAWPIESSPDLAHYWSPGYNLDGPETGMIMEVLPPLSMTNTGDIYLGKFSASETLSVTFDVLDQNQLEETRLSSKFTVWVHNWDGEPDALAWWTNPVNNVYHHDITDDVSVSQGSYTIDYVIDDTLLVFGSNSRLALDVRVGITNNEWDFEFMAGDVYTVSGTISEPDGTPIEHVKVSLVDHQAGIGYDTDTDEFGAYSVIAPAGTYDFNAWPDDPELGGYWTSGFDLSANMPDYDLVLAPQVYVDYDGDHFLGQKGNGATVEVTFELRNNADEEVPGLGDQFEVWIHDWDNDPDQNSWWDNPVNNLYHWDVTDLVTITEGSYTLEYIVDGSLPIFNSEGHRNLEIRIGNAGYGWGFRYISGEVYTISGVVQDSTGAPVENVWVNLWTEEDVYGVDTDDLGRFSISAPSGTYELSAWPDDSELSGHWEPKFDLNDDSAGMVITLFEEVWFDYAGNWNLGTYAAGETVSVTFELRDNNNNPVSGLSDSFVIWMHDWDGDPNPHEWWTNPVSNNYHWEVTDDVTIIEGSYTLEYVIDNTKPVFAAGGERRFQVNLGFYQLEWDFYYSSGGQYTLSGVVTDSFGAPVDGAMVELMGQEDEYNTFTNQFGQYILDVSDGQYELLVVPLDHSVLSAYFDMGLTINDDLQQDIELESIVAGVSLTGGVYDVTFTPIEGAEVVLLDGTTMYYSVTNVLGEYSILAPSGTYERLMVMPPEEPAYEDYAMLSFTRYELLETQVQNVYLMIGPPDEPI